MNKTINSFYMSGRTIQHEIFDGIMASKVSIFIQFSIELLQFSSVSEAMFAIDEKMYVSIIQP